MRDAIKTLLEGDSTLMSTLTGGVHTKTDISRQATPGAFDSNGELKPCALLKISSQRPDGPYHQGSSLTFELWFYERSGYDNVEAARERAYTLLHRQSVTPSSGSNWEIRHADDVPDGEDDALDASVAVSRYQAFVLRQ